MSLRELCIRRLRKLFPNVLRFATLENGGRCASKACPWPAVPGKRWCRRCLFDAVSARSALPCGLGQIVADAAARHGHHASTAE